MSRERTYLRVVWPGSGADFPVVILSELDEARWELRKVEIFRDGRLGYAGGQARGGTTALARWPIPGLAAIASSHELRPAQIDRDAFESIWHAATGNRSAAHVASA